MAGREPQSLHNANKNHSGRSMRDEGMQGLSRAAAKGRFRRYRMGGFYSLSRWPVALLACLLVVVTGCDSPKPPLRVASIQWVGYQPLHLAQDLDLFPEGRIRVADFTSNTESLRAFRNRNVEVAALTLDEVLLLRHDGHDARVILILDYSEGADAIVARPEIDDLAGLRGKRIGVESTAATAYLLARGLEFAGLSVDDVEIVKLNAGMQEQAYREGRIDAVATFEPLRTHLVNMGARELFNSTQIPGEIVDVLVTRGEIIDQREDDLVTLIDGWFRAIRHAEQRPDEAARMLAPRLGLSASEYRSAVAGMSFPSRTENCRLLADNGRAMADPLGRLHGLMTAQGLFRTATPPQNVFDDRILEALGCDTTAFHTE